MTKDPLITRMFAVALVLAGLATLGTILYLAIIQVALPEMLVSLAALTIGALLPSPIEARVGKADASVRPPADV